MNLIHKFITLILICFINYWKRFVFLRTNFITSIKRFGHQLGIKLFIVIHHNTSLKHPFYVKHVLNALCIFLKIGCWYICAEEPWGIRKCNIPVITKTLRTGYRCLFSQNSNIFSGLFCRAFGKMWNSWSNSISRCWKFII